jgi:hypothetical protein
LRRPPAVGGLAATAAATLARVAAEVCGHARQIAVGLRGGGGGWVGGADAWLCFFASLKRVNRNLDCPGDFQLSARPMSTKYQTGHQVPAEFPRILKDFVREILRYQPKNIYQFGAEYFEDKLQGGSKLSPLQMSREQLVKYFHEIFVAADADGSGQLDKKEFKKLMESSEMDLPKKAVKALYSEVSF